MGTPTLLFYTPGLLNMRVTGLHSLRPLTTILKVTDKFCGIAGHNELVWFSEHML